MKQWCVDSSDYQCVKCTVSFLVTVVGDPKVCRCCCKWFTWAKCKLLVTPNNGKEAEKLCWRNHISLFNLENKEFTFLRKIFMSPQCFSEIFRGRFESGVFLLCLSLCVFQDSEGSGRDEKWKALRADIKIRFISELLNGQIFKSSFIELWIISSPNATWTMPSTAPRMGRINASGLSTCLAISMTIKFSNIMPAKIAITLSLQFISGQIARNTMTAAIP